MITCRPFRRRFATRAWRQRCEPEPGRYWNRRESAGEPMRWPGWRYVCSIRGGLAWRRWRFPARRPTPLYEYLLRWLSGCGLPRRRLPFRRWPASVRFLRPTGGDDSRCRPGGDWHPGWRSALLPAIAGWTRWRFAACRARTCARPRTRLPQRPRSSARAPADEHGARSDPFYAPAIGPTQRV